MAYLPYSVPSLPVSSIDNQKIPNSVANKMSLALSSNPSLWKTPDGEIPPSSSLVQNPIVSFYFLFVCGDGKYRWIPGIWIVWAIVISLFFIYVQYGNTLLVCTAIVCMLSIVTNITFGYFYCKEHLLHKWLTRYAHQFDVDTQKFSSRFLGTGGWIILLTISIMIACTGFESFYARENTFADKNNSEIAAVFLAITSFYVLVIGGSMFLGLIWSFHLVLIFRSLEKWSVHDEFHCLQLSAANKNAMNSPSQQFSITDRQKFFSKHLNTLDHRIFAYFQDMRVLSNFWRYNHFFRFLASVVIGCECVVLLLSSLDDTNVFHLLSFNIAALALFYSVWATSLWTGYVNDLYSTTIIRDLITLSNNQYSTVTIDATGSEISKKDISKPSFLFTVEEEVAVLELLGKVRSVVYSEGLHFAGIKLSLETAFGIGSFIMSMIIFVLKFLIFR